jgi:hypothetical protein
MARAVFLLTLLANLIFFIWAAGYLGGQDEGREPERLRNQLQPERLQVTVGDQQPSPPAPATAPAVVAAVTACLRVGPMETWDAEILKTAVAAEGGSTTQTAVEEVSYWVYIPANAGKPADKEIIALRQAGMKDYFIVSDEGANRNTISLGLFHKEDMAKEMVQRLAKKGIKSAKIAAKTRPTGKTFLQVRGEAAKLEKVLKGRITEGIDCPKD